VEQSHFWGYSMGGFIGLVAASHAPKRFLSFVIGGAAPGPRSKVQDDNSRAMLELLDRGREALLAAMPEIMRPSIADADPRALAANMRAMLANPNQEAFAPEVPCLIYNGGVDPSALNARAMQSSVPGTVQFAEIAELGHIPACVRSDVVLPVVLPFLRRVVAEAGPDRRY
jgi:pimeloyl-ACP methyl ester carboxylesterase